MLRNPPPRTDFMEPSQPRRSKGQSACTPPKASGLPGSILAPPCRRTWRTRWRPCGGDGQGRYREPTAGFAPAWAGLRDRCLFVSSHIGNAGVQGFEPCSAALETACSPRSTLLYRVSGGNRTRRLDLHRVLCQATTPQTPSVEPQLALDWTQRSSPSRGHSGRQGSRTLISVGRTALAERPGQPYPATFRSGPTGS